MIYVCPEKDRAVQKPCELCICGMDKLPAFQKPKLAARDIQEEVDDVCQSSTPTCNR